MKKKHSSTLEDLSVLNDADKKAPTSSAV